MATLLANDSAPVLFFNNCAYGDITIESLAGQLKAYISGLTYNDGTSVTQVDLVAHSMGGLVARAYLAGLQPGDGSFVPPPDTRVRKLVLAATPNFGSFEAVGLGVQAPEMVPGSTFLWSLARWNQNGDDLRGVDALAVVGNGGTYYASASQDDGVVSLTSGAIGFAYAGQRTRIVPYCHVTPSLETFFGTVGMICSAYQGIVDINSAAHLTARIVRSFLANTTDWTSIGETPSQNPYLSAYGGMYFGETSASGVYESLTQAAFGGIPLLPSASSDGIFY